MLMLANVAMVAAAAAALPPHHPQHHAPPELLHRIRHSNPAILQGANGATEVPAGHPTRAPFRPGGLRVSPVDFGADPTGVRDSWAALNRSISHCLNQSALSPNGFFPGQDSTPSFGPIRDMGGCDIDLGECVEWPRGSATIVNTSAQTLRASVLRQIWVASAKARTVSQNPFRSPRAELYKMQRAHGNTHSRASLPVWQGAASTASRGRSCCRR